MAHERFHYKSLDELKKTAVEVGASLPFADHTGILGTPVRFGTATASNRLGIAPMEGADAMPDGSPSDYTRRRYCRQAAGGSAVIWFEAISVVPEGCSSGTQLLITRENVDAYRRLCDEVREVGFRENGVTPLLVMQANHSGRYSNPGNRPAPLIAYRHPWLEQFRPADDSCIVSDDYLMALEERFGEGTRLAREAGFDGVDIKSCHGYLFAEHFVVLDKKHCGLIFQQQLFDIRAVYLFQQLVQDGFLDKGHLHIRQRLAIPQHHAGVQQVADVIGAAPNFRHTAIHVQQRVHGLHTGSHGILRGEDGIPLRLGELA